MKNRLQIYLLGLSPLILAFLVWDLDFSANTGNSDINQTDNRSIPDAIVENPQLRQYNLSGELEQLIQGRELYSYSKENRLLVILPRFLVNEDSGDLWSISATEGSFFEQRDIFRLQGDVEMLRQSEQTPLSLKTSSLDIHLSERTIETLATILIEAPGHRISGEGFRADLDSNRFEIISNVISRHDSI